MDCEWIICMQCDNEFEFDEAEQARYAEKGYDAPHRCPECRKHKTKIIYLGRQKESRKQRKIFRDRDEDNLRRPNHAGDR